MNIDDTFSHHAPPSVEHVLAYELNRSILRKAAHELKNNTPECAERTLGLRRLQEAMFYFNAAIALNPGKLPQSPIS